MPAPEHASQGVTGILLVDKPEEITSHGVVARIRRIANTRKVGHAGTLDPMATGLLVVGIGTATRLLTYFVGLDKQYLATIRLGRATTTDDREGEPLGDEVDATSLDSARIDAAVADLTGPIMQAPSSVSAIKVDGVRSYTRVRSGEEVDLPPRPVTVSEFTVLGASRPSGGPAGALDLDVRVTCSSGTYIRALARDLGRALGTGGHLTALRRTRVGPFAVDEAAPLTELMDGRPAEPLPAADAAGRLLPVVHLDDDARTADIRNGKRVPLPGVDDGSPVAALGPDGVLLALVEVKRGVARVLTGFPQEARP
ncbi:tRNA pseudouridine(55) synthase TruB [Herbiconiux sp. L3-i23]|uniref:tRNA pseudouridine(55) synthase TruB n=1 Tax=Herbiconiux sp. L3-i23 TaxID=2905871 RepID=UPI0020743307|nr:tRNA pseudouridine(55) synthase TruB [Herbiconiux sp. L3-i23]